MIPELTFRNSQMASSGFLRMMLKRIGLFLRHCARTKAIGGGLTLHAAVIKSGAGHDIVISNHVLNFYAKCGSIDSARQMFDEMPQRNLVTWSAMVSGYDQSNQPRSALKIFSEMRKCFKPNEFVVASALSSCSNVKEIELGRQIHGQVLKLCLASVSFVFNSIISLYMKCGIYTDALLVFSEGHESDCLNLVSYNIAIVGLVEIQQPEKAIEMYKNLCLHGLAPDCFTFSGLFRNIESLGCDTDTSLVMQLHCQMAKLGLDCVAFCANVLLAVYFKLNLLQESVKVFKSIADKDVTSWNTVISGFCCRGDQSKAVSVFREMVMDDIVSPDDYTFATVLSAAADQASIRHGKEIHCRLLRTQLGWDTPVGNALINVYAKTGSITSSYTIFTQMKIHNVVSCNSIIAAFAHIGLAAKAIGVLEEMLQAALEPDSITFLELLTACNYSGLTNEGLALFNSMSTVYAIPPGIEHLACLVDLLGRAGRVAEAIEYVQRYSMGSDMIVLGSLLSACRLHGRTGPGEEIGKKLLELHPGTTSPYVLLSNLFASDAKWDGVEWVRKMQQRSGLTKEAARSLMAS